MIALLVIFIAVAALLAWRVGRLHWQIDALERRMSGLETRRPNESPVHAPPPVSAPNPGGTGALPSPAPQIPPTVRPSPPPVQNLGRDSTSPSKPAPAIDWEQFMGVKLFAWLGGLALLSALFFSSNIPSRTA